MAARSVGRDLFKGRHPERGIIILCVRCYLSDKLGSRDPVENRAASELKSAGAMPRRVRVRLSRHLNNVIEQDHRRVQQRLRPMPGFERFDHAAVTTSGIELARKIKKGQFKTRQVAGRRATVPEIWAALTAA